ncbi:MAG: hypothetical protein Q9182_004482 [Xanthomendoza sp. 2 TL-2023]
MTRTEHSQGDLGLTAESVEESLEEKFHLAQVWDCLLLLDEADVFLAERSDRDIKRNSLVSVFLRVLEYYTGILFLTTNRVAGFDEAFKSRIHLPLYFPPLKRKQTLAIWKVNLKRTLERMNGTMDADKGEIMAFAEKHFLKGKKQETNWNGRQIRNAFQTAAALAVFEAQKVTVRGPVYSTLNTRHFEVVAQAAEQFDMYIQDIDGLKPMARILQKGIRNDKFRAKEIHINPPDAGLIKSPTSARTPGFRGKSKDVDEEELEVPAGGAGTRVPRMQNDAFEEYGTEAMSFSQPQSAQQRRMRKGPRPQPIEVAQAPRPRSNYTHGYQTPDSSNRGTSSYIPQEEGDYDTRAVSGQSKRREPARKYAVTAGTPIRARHPEPEEESDEPDYSPVDSKDEE